MWQLFKWVEAWDAARHPTEYRTQHSPGHQELSGPKCPQYKVEKLCASYCGIQWSQITLLGNVSASCKHHVSGSPSNTLEAALCAFVLILALNLRPGCRHSFPLGILDGLSAAMAACVISLTQHLPAASREVLNLGHPSPASSSLVRRELLQLVTERAASWV